MKREILFRGKRIDNGEWVEGYLTVKPRYGNTQAYFIEFVEVITKSGIFDGLKQCSYEVIPETVGQFTGVTDKNGVKIFEGDILKFYGLKNHVQQSFSDISPEIDTYIITEHTDIVSFKGGCFLLESCNEDDEMPFIYSISRCCIENVEDVKKIIFGFDYKSEYSEEETEIDMNGNKIDESVLGVEKISNIHDNPDLINKK